MTIGRLQKLLTVLVEKGHARKRVCVQKNTFRHALEDEGAIILDVDTAGLESFPLMGDDGGTKERADGSESCHTALVIKGDADPTLDW